MEEYIIIVTNKPEKEKAVTRKKVVSFRAFWSYWYYEVTSLMNGQLQLFVIVANIKKNIKTTTATTKTRQQKQTKQQQYNNKY